MQCGMVEIEMERYNKLKYKRASLRGHGNLETWVQSMTSIKYLQCHFEKH